MRVFVRRGGPNWQQGLAKMRALSQEINVPIEVRFSQFADTSVILVKHKHLVYLVLAMVDY